MGLPHDTLSIENAILVTRRAAGADGRPTDTGEPLGQEPERSNNMVVTKLSD